MSPLRQCEACGCTDDDACIDDDGDPCGWASEELCTSCARQDLEDAHERPGRLQRRRRRGQGTGP